MDPQIRMQLELTYEAIESGKYISNCNPLPEALGRLMQS